MEEEEMNALAQELAASTQVDTSAGHLSVDELSSIVDVFEQ